MQHELYIIAGANGSGKSTFALAFLKQKHLVFINADDIARESKSGDIKAGKKALLEIQSLLTNRTSFAFETTLSGNYLSNIIDQANGEGYQITLVYVFLEKVRTCIERIEDRVKKGGHHIPDDVVKRRYTRSKHNFWYKYKDMVNKWYLYYNGKDESVLVAEGIKNKQFEIQNNILYNIFMEDMNGS